MTMLAVLFPVLPIAQILEKKKKRLLCENRIYVNNLLLLYFNIIKSELSSSEL